MLSRFGFNLIIASIPILFTLRRLLRRKQARRTKQLPPAQERVLILGASSGIGRAIAHRYSSRAAKVCVVGRREDKVLEVVAECRARGSSSAVGVTADFSDVEDMIRVRDKVEKEWQGLDTLVVAAGASSLLPLMEVAGLEVHGRNFTPAQASREAIQHTYDVASKAVSGNYLGPVLAAVTFIPLLQNTSAHPAILLISSAAAVIPAPTRSIYCATKSASLLLYQSLCIEHPAISFSLAIPATVEGDFRAGAVDNGTVREADPNQGSSKGLSRVSVAERCVDAVDGRERYVWMATGLGGGTTYRLAHLMYWVWPGWIEKKARKKYNFQ